MSNYIGWVLTPSLSSRHIAKIIVPSGGLYAGQVAYLESLSSSISKNYEVFTATKPLTANFGSEHLAMVLNGGFETLSDGRRPSGQPDFTQYQYQEGEIATVAYIDRHLLFNISADAIDSATRANAAVGKYLIPLNDSNNLAVADSVASTTACSLKILSAYSMPVGGNFGLDFATTYICVAENEKIDTSNLMYTFTLPNQVGSSVINHTAGTIAVTVAGTRTGIAATFTTSIDSTVTVGAATQVSGVTTNTFTSPVTYVVTSESGLTKNYVVTVSLEAYSLTEIDEDEHTTISVTRGGTPVTVGVDNINYGDALVITATADTGYTLDTLEVNGETFVSGQTHTVTGDVAISATSVVNTYDLAITETDCTITVLIGETPVTAGTDVLEYGQVLTITAVPDGELTMTVLTVNGVAFTSGETHTVEGNVTIVGTAA
jgi:hypothetical protein